MSESDSFSSNLFIAGREEASIAAIFKSFSNQYGHFSKREATRSFNDRMNLNSRLICLTTTTKRNWKVFRCYVRNKQLTLLGLLRQGYLESTSDIIGRSLDIQERLPLSVLIIKSLMAGRLLFFFPFFHSACKAATAAS